MKKERSYSYVFVDFIDGTEVLKCDVKGKWGIIGVHLVLTESGGIQW